VVLEVFQNIQDSSLHKKMHLLSAFSFYQSTSVPVTYYFVCYNEHTITCEKERMGIIQSFRTADVQRICIHKILYALFMQSEIQRVPQGQATRVASFQYPTPLLDFDENRYEES